MKPIALGLKLGRSPNRLPFVVLVGLFLAGWGASAAGGGRGSIAPADSDSAEPDEAAPPSTDVPEPRSTSGGGAPDSANKSNPGSTAPKH